MALIAHYPLNGDTKDYSGYGKDGVARAPVWVDGKIGKAIEMPSASDWISVGTITPPSKFSLCLWHISKSDKGSGTWRTLLGTNRNDHPLIFSNKTNLGMFLGGFTSFGYTITEGEWVHISVVYDLDYKKASLYINGDFYSSVTCNYNPTTSPITAVGGAANFSYSSGTLNDIRIYDHALSDKEVKEIAKAKVLHYKYDEQDLTTQLVKDSSGFRNDGTVTLATAPTWSEDSPVGRGSMVFDGSKEIDTQNTFPFRRDSEFTASLWVNIDNHSHKAGAAAGLLGKGHYYSNVWDLFIRNNNTVSFECSGNPTREGYLQITTPPLSIGIWYLVSLVYNKGAVRLYLNGDVSATGTYTGSGDFDGPNRVLIGKRFGDSSRSLEGSTSDVRIYATALSPEDILELYQTRASIDDKGTMHAHEFIEGLGSSVSERGLVEHINIIETGEGSASFSADTLYINELKEI